jgi:hypothetical protein
VVIKRRWFVAGAAALLVVGFRSAYAEKPADTIVVTLDGKGNVLTTPSLGLPTSRRIGTASAGDLIGEIAKTLVDAVPKGTPAAALLVTQFNGAAPRTIAGFVIATGNKPELAAKETYEKSFPGGALNRNWNGIYLAVPWGVPNSLLKKDPPTPEEQMRSAVEVHAGHGSSHRKTPVRIQQVNSRKPFGSGKPVLN